MPAAGPGLGEFTSTESSAADAPAPPRSTLLEAPHPPRETSGMVALVGALVIMAGAVALSILVWSETPVWLSRAVPAAAPRPAPAPPATAVHEPSRAPVPPPAAPQPESRTPDPDPASVPVAPSPPPPAPPSVEPAAPAAITATGPPAGVGEVLDAYRRAFNTLDAGSVAAVWPGADVDTLKRTFSALRYQHVSFDRCRTQVTAADYAVTSCQGSISNASNSGDPALRRRSASWTIAMRRIAGHWTIENLSTR